MTDKERIEQLEAENAQLKAKVTATHRVTFKISPKGGVSAYGLGRFPVTLYGSQWTALLAEANALRGFLLANKERLATKD